MVSTRPSASLGRASSDLASYYDQLEESAQFGPGLELIYSAVRSIRSVQRKLLLGIATVGCKA